MHGRQDVKAEVDVEILLDVRAAEIPTLSQLCQQVRASFMLPIAPGTIMTSSSWDRTSARGRNNPYHIVLAQLVLAQTAAERIRGRTWPVPPLLKQNLSPARRRV